MKNKNLIVLGAIGVGLYYLLKKDKPTSTTSIEGGGNLPQSEASSQSFTPKDLTGANRQIVLTEDVGNTKRMSRQLIFKLPYRGGARPTAFMERTSGKWIVRGNLPNLTTTKVCKNSEGGDFMPIGMPFDDERNCVMVAETKNVVQWIFNNDIKWNAKFGKKVGGFFDGMQPPMSKPSINGIRKGMPTPMNKPSWLKGADIRN